MQAQNNMRIQNDEMNQAMQRLSSGLRINTAADDAAGSAIASKMEAQVRSLDVAIRNSYDAISMTQTAEGALGEMENILQRVRELAVQASNSTLSQNDRDQIQAEVTQLTNEIDNIASTTHFNNIKLLNGDNANVTFQIGINEENALSVDLEKSDSATLGLTGSTGVGVLTSGRMLKTTYNSSSLAASDVKINGFDALAAAFSTDLSGAAVNTAGSLATAINANTGVHGAEANAFNSLTAKDMGTFNMTQTFTINSATVALASSLSGLVDNINESVSGIEAVLNSADNNFTLKNTTGNDIIVASNSAAIGLTAGTYTGFIELSNLDGSGVRIEAETVENGYSSSSAGTIADVQLLGFNEFSVPGELETDAVSGTALNASEIKINDVLIGSSLSGSANHIADAINEKTAEHGVTADASNAVDLTFNFASGNGDARPSGRTDFKINGTSVDLTAALDAAAVVTAINNAAIGDIRAETKDTGAVRLTSASGVNIIVANSDNDFLSAATDVNGTSLTSGFGNGTYDLDGLLTSTTPTAAANQALDTSDAARASGTGKSLIGEVVNSRVVVTQLATANYTGSSAKVKVTGTNSAGASITEEITLTNGTINDQIQGSTIFHTVTSLHITGTAANAAIQVGVNGRAVGTGNADFDEDSLFTSATSTAAGTLTLSGNRVTSGTATDLGGSIVTIDGRGGNYSSSTVTFTVVGTDVFGATISEEILLNTNSGHVHGTTAFHTITSVETSAALQTTGVLLGSYQVGDRIAANGKLTMSNGDKSPIKIEAVSEDHIAGLAAAADTILEKVGVNNQSQSFEAGSSGVSVINLADANAALSKIDAAIDKLSLFRSSFGAVENRIDANVNNLTTLKVNTEAAMSRIQDADFATETTNLTKSQILAQAATSMLAQANASKQNLLALLQG
jgi:flagellin